MDARYSFLVDPSRDLIRISLSGLYEAEDVVRFVRARNAAHEGLLCGPNQHITLTDVRLMKIQSQEVVAAFRDLLADDRYRSRKLAFIITPSLTMRQLMRAIDQRHAKCFEDPAEALKWLLMPDAHSTIEAPVPRKNTA